MNTVSKRVSGKNGLRGTITSTDQASGKTAVQLESGQLVEIESTLLQAQKDGSYFLPLSAEEIDSQSVVIPVIQEEAQITKEQVTKGVVRITKKVQEHEEVIDEPLLREHVSVERVPIDRVVEGETPQPRQEGDTLIIPVLEEVIVVEKRLILKEELHVTRHHETVVTPQRVTLRSESVTVENKKAD